MTTSDAATSTGSPARPAEARRGSLLVYWLSRIDFGWVAVVLLSLFAVIPLLANPGLPNGSDVLYHTYRAAEMSRSWEYGVLFPRWAEGLYYGYGSPLWHFYASLTYYLTSVGMNGLGLSALGALRALLALSFLGAGAGMYVFVRGQVGRLAGVLAALVYLYSPYLIYTEPYARGTYPELLAFALFPFVMAAFAALRRTGHGRDVLWSGLLLFLLIIAHNLMALTLTGLLGLWLVWDSVTRVDELRGDRRRLWLPFAALVLGVGVAAYFWLPVLLESDTVKLGNLTGVALLDYRNFFVPLTDLAAFFPLPDHGAINGLRNVLIFGVPQWVLAAAALPATLIYAGVHMQEAKAAAALRLALFLALVALVMVYLITPAAAPVWNWLTPLRYLQFPWRLLGPLAFCFAVLAGLHAAWLERLPGRVRAALVALIVAAVIGLAAPAFSVPEWRHTQVDTSIAAYHAVEVAGGQRGTTFTNEYLPVTVHTLPDATPRLLRDYADGHPVNRANVPAGVMAEVISSGPQHNTWRVDAPEDFTMEVYTFAWAGWRALVDGQQVPITPSREHGLITFPVPAGEHSVQVHLGTTWPRLIGSTLSGLSLVLLLGLAALMRGRDRPVLRIARVDGPARVGLALGGVLALAVVGVSLGAGLTWRDTLPGESPAANPVDYRLGEDFRLLGYDINGERFAPGDTLRVTLYWYALRETDVNFSSFVHVSTGGPPVAQADKLHPGERAISEWWTPEGYIYDAYTISLPPDMPPGQYDITAGLYTCELMPPGDCGNGYRPPVTDTDGQPVGDTVPLTTITVEEAGR